MPFTNWEDLVRQRRQELGLPKEPEQPKLENPSNIGTNLLWFGTFSFAIAMITIGISNWDTAYPGPERAKDRYEMGCKNPVGTCLPFTVSGVLPNERLCQTSRGVEFRAAGHSGSIGNDYRCLEDAMNAWHNAKHGLR